VQRKHVSGKEIIRKGSTVLAMVGLQQLRNDVGLTQEELAQRANVTARTIRRAEAGRTVNYSTAMKIRDVINTVRSEQGKETITLEELGLTIS
jgi:DNA-binding XRE family transcriptional regulator